VTEHLRRFGAIEITRGEYHRLLEEALGADAYFPGVLEEDPVAVLQSSSVTS
jgi:Leu/Phe-tRNA-protein transferase